MVEKEGKGFVVKDKRFFSEEEKKEEKKEEKEGKTEQKQRAPLPEVSFNGLIFSLSSSALIYLGEVPDPNSNKKTKDLELAKHTIDTISMLKEKTKGNLTGEEEKFLDSVLADLRWRYVKASGL
ncbi:MAG: DUF1844 domain-containing protein [Deltaproteobacteria bacterium]|nr:MAG: DUF1844 domain-containing protein [Deltaproteobacteria bacterium]